MKISKPLHLSCIHRTFSYLERHFFSVGGILPFNLQNGEIKMEQEFWAAVGSVLGEGFFDSGMIKETPEFLIAGKFFAPESTAVEAGWVRAKVGNLEKKLSVTGDRYWLTDNQISTPKLMTEMPITYRYAFGGDKNEFNTAGKGDYRGLERTDDPRPLPNVEYPDHLVTSLNSAPPPAGLNQTDMMTEPRRSMMGTYDSNTAPYTLAPDIQWRVFNDAAADQWFNKPLTGEESYEFTYMHPDLSLINGSLPKMKMRGFINRSEEGIDPSDSPVAQEYGIEELRLVLDTLWFAPHLNLGALVFHGATEVSDRFAEEIQHLLFAFEDFSQSPKPLEHYKHSMQMREDPKQAPAYALMSKDISAESCETDLEAMVYDADVDAVKGFTGDNIESYLSTKTAETKQAIATKMRESDEQLRSATEDLDVEPLKDQIAQLDAEILSLSGLKVSNDESDAAANLRDSKAQLEAVVEKFEGIKAQAANTIPNLNAKIDEAYSQTDPELQALMLFIEEKIAPKSQRYPEQIDIAKIDFPAMEELPERIEQYVKSKLGQELPKVSENLSDAKKQIEESRQRVNEALQDAEAETKKAVEHANRNLGVLEGSNIESIDAVPSLDIPDLTSLSTELNTTLTDLENQMADLEAMTTKLLTGEKIPQPLFRPPSSDPLDDLEKEINAQLGELKVQLAEVNEEVKNGLSDEILSSNFASATSRGVDDITAKLQPARDKISEISKQGIDFQELERTVEELQTQAATLEEHKQQLASSAPALKNTYRLGAHYNDPGLSPHTIDISEVRDQFLRSAELEQDFHASDIACIDLSDCTLSNFSLADSYIEQVDFSGAATSNVDFSLAIMVRNILSRATFENCDFSAANLGAASFAQSRFQDCDFKETILSGAKFSNSSFSQCSFHANQLLDVTMKDVVFEHCTFSELFFIETDLQDVSFRNCKVAKGVFMQGQGCNTHFTESELEKVIFVDRVLDECDFQATKLTNVAFMGDISMRGCNFEQATLDTVSYKGINLRGSNFQQTTMANVLFADADLESSNLSYTSYVRGQFGGARLFNAKLNGANLMESCFDQANIQRADFSNANLYFSSFIDSTVGNTNFFGANLDNSMFEGWQPE